MFQDSPSVMGLIGYPEMSVTNYQSTLHKILEEQRSDIHCCSSLKLRMVNIYHSSQHTMIQPTPFHVACAGCVLGKSGHKAIIIFPSEITSSVIEHSQPRGVKLKMRAQIKK
jgi:hypothetical protein